MDAGWFNTSENRWDLEKIETLVTLPPEPWLQEVSRSCFHSVWGVSGSPHPILMFVFLIEMYFIHRAT